MADKIPNPKSSDDEAIKSTKTSTIDKNVTPKKSTKPDSKANAKPDSKAKPVDEKNSKDKSKPEVKTIGHKKEGAWSKLWVRIVVIIIIVLVAIFSIWGVYRLLGKNKRSEGKVELATGDAAISEDFWTDLEAGEQKSKLTKALPLYKDAAVIYAINDTGLINNPNNQIKWDNSNEKADKTIDDQKESLKKQYRGNWEEKYDQYLISLGYFGDTSQMEHQWKNDLVAADMVGILTQSIQWKTYDKTDEPADFIWCTDTSVNNICFGYDDKTGNVDENDTASKLNKLLRSAFVMYLMDYQPLAMSHVLIMYTYTGADSNPVNGTQIVIDAPNIRNWFNLNKTIEGAEANDMDGTNDMDFEQAAINYSADGSAANGGFLGLVSARSTGWTSEFSTMAYAGVADFLKDDGSFGVSTSYMDPSTDLVTSANIDEAIADNTSLNVGGYTGDSSLDTIITNSNTSNQIGQSIWELFGSSTTAHNTRKAVYKYDDVDTKYISDGANNTFETQTGTTDLYATHSQNGLHVSKINGTFDVTDSTAGITPTSSAKWYTAALADPINSTVFENANLNPYLAMGFELMREDLVAMSVDSTNPGTYGMKASFNTWVSSAAEELILRVYLNDPAFLSQNGIVDDNSAPIISETDDQITSTEVRNKLNDDKQTSYLTNINAYIEGSANWFSQYANKGYDASMDLDALFTGAINILSNEFDNI